MRTCLLLAAVLFLSGVSFAEEAVKPEQLKTMYDDALAQLKSAQDRKAELAKENEALSAKVQLLQKQLAATHQQVRMLKQEVSDNEDRNYFLRAYYAAWQSFLKHHPDLLAAWKSYLGNSVMSVPADFPDLLSPDWQLSLEEDDIPDLNAAQTAHWQDSTEPANASPEER